MCADSASFATEVCVGTSLDWLVAVPPLAGVGVMVCAKLAASRQGKTMALRNLDIFWDKS